MRLLPSFSSRSPARRRALWALVWLAACAWRAYADAHFAAPIVQQSFIGFIIAALSAIAGWFGAAAGAISTAALATLHWLGSGLNWLTGSVTTVIKATGRVFAKVWDYSRRLWSDVLQPALHKLARWIQDAREWMKRKLAPAFRLIEKIRDRVRAIYRKFVQPVLDAIETTRAVLQVLAKLHVPFARALDGYLTQVEQAIAENYLKILFAINQVTDLFNSIVTGELLFQRVPFIRTLQRDAPHWIQMWWNAQLQPLSAEERAALGSAQVEAVDPKKLSKNLGDFYRNGSGELAPIIRELVPLYFGSASTR